MTKDYSESVEKFDESMHEKSINALVLSMEIYHLMQLNYISIDTREQLRNLSQKLLEASNEMTRLKEQIKEEYYNGVQDTED